MEEVGRGLGCLGILCMMVEDVESLTDPTVDLPEKGALRSDLVHVGESGVDDMSIEAALVCRKDVDRHADVREFRGGAVPSLFDSAGAKADLRDEGAGIGLHNIQAETLLCAGIDEVEEFANLGAIGDDVVGVVFRVKVTLAEVAGCKHAKIGNSDEIRKSVRDGEGEVARCSRAVDIEFELAPVVGDFLNDDVETERGGEASGGEVRHPGLVVVGVGEGGISIPTERDLTSLEVMFEVVALLVAGPLLDVHGFSWEVDEGFDPVGTVVAHADGKVLKGDVVKGMV